MVTLVAFVVLLGVLITVHEFGHFLVAKAAGVKVQVFSIGFGRAILSRTIGETEYRIALFPVGGYVQMLGMNPDDVPAGADEGRDLLSKPPLTRILIFLAGPGMNLLLPFMLLVPFFTFSDQVDEVIGNQVGAVDASMPAYAGGLRAGDRIVEMDGAPVYAFWQVAQRIHDYDPDAGGIALKVERHGAEGPLDLTVVPKLVERTDRRVNLAKKSYHIGFQPAFLAPDVAVTGPQTPAARAGLKTFDRVLSVGGEAVTRLVDVQRRLAAVPAGQTVAVEVERDAPLDEQFTFFVRQERRTLSYTGAPGEDPGLAHAGPCISSVAPGTPAGEKLRVGDCIISVDGYDHSLGTFVENRLGNGPDQPKTLRVRRDGQIIEVTIEPRKVVHTDPLAGEIVRWQRGLVLMSRPLETTAVDKVANTDRLAFAWDYTVRYVTAELEITLNMVAGLFTGRVSATQLSGPITIAAIAGQYARAGFEHFLHLMIMLSLSIALLNLLPVPGLDGGQMMVASIELIVRRPLSRRTRQALQIVGAAMILLLILFVTGNDLMRQWRLHAG